MSLCVSGLVHTGICFRKSTVCLARYEALRASGPNQKSAIYTSTTIVPVLVPRKMAQTRVVLSIQDIGVAQCTLCLPRQTQHGPANKKRLRNLDEPEILLGAPSSNNLEHSIL